MNRKKVLKNDDDQGFEEYRKFINRYNLRRPKRTKTREEEKEELVKPGALQNLGKEILELGGEITSSERRLNKYRRESIKLNDEIEAKMRKLKELKQQEEELREGEE
jgi:predicted RNase H-like nuclease (RuvC/YqgF family)